jgi:hypothetical protein
VVVGVALELQPAITKAHTRRITRGTRTFFTCYLLFLLYLYINSKFREMLEMFFPEGCKWATDNVKQYMAGDLNQAPWIRSV